MSVMGERFATGAVRTFPPTFDLMPENTATFLRGARGRLVIRLQRFLEPTGLEMNVNRRYLHLALGAISAFIAAPTFLPMPARTFIGPATASALMNLRAGMVPQ